MPSLAVAGRPLYRRRGPAFPWEGGADSAVATHVKRCHHALVQQRTDLGHGWMDESSSVSKSQNPASQPSGGDCIPGRGTSRQSCQSSSRRSSPKLRNASARMNASASSSRNAVRVIRPWSDGKAPFACRTAASLGSQRTRRTTACTPHDSRKQPETLWSRAAC